MIGLSIIKVVIAYFVDRIVGDPARIPHPVVIIGKFITMLEKIIRSVVIHDKSLKAAGLLFPLFIGGGAYLVTALLIWGIHYVSPLTAALVEIWLIATTVATKGLEAAALKIYLAVTAKDIKCARFALSMVVGRDTENLDESEICRGAVETVAENIVDAIISPLFYAVIGGAPLAMAYRAVNTLDSMVGYKNEKYLHLGWASARLDDVMNYIPARITAVLLLVASLLKKYHTQNALRILLRDAKFHPSPNSGYPEATVAGALDIQLGGINYYQGVPSNRAKMGDQIKKIEPNDITKTIILMKLVSLLFLLCNASAVALVYLLLT